MWPSRDPSPTVAVPRHVYGRASDAPHAPPQATPPTIFGGFALLRAVLLRERISLVHAHGAFSAIAHEAIIHARTMGYKVAFPCSQLHVLTLIQNTCNAGVLQLSC